MKREPVSQKMRFEVFKRDKFTCQYCGRKAPDIILEVDHIKPVSKNGTTVLLNLTTSCYDCNRGKSNKELDDNSTVAKQRKQMELLQERKEQIDMMIKWHESLKTNDDYATKKVEKYWSKVAYPYSCNESGKRTITKLLKTYSLESLLKAIDISKNYFVYKDNTPTHESIENAFNKIGGICNINKQKEDDPNVSKLYYIRGIVRNRYNYSDPNWCITLLKQAYKLGCDIDGLQSIAESCRNWTEWKTEMNLYMEDTKNA